MKAPEILKRASDIMDERAKQYDSPEGERSMGKAVAAFNAITGQELSEANGWLLMALLKMVRDNTTDTPHEDSIHDLVAYAGLYGEARMASDGWIAWGGWDECPLEIGTIIDAKYRDGFVEKRVPAGDYNYSLDSRAAKDWCHTGSDYDIIAYRIVK